ncbi:sulfotransferase [Streptomyces sp. NPDC091371]|uniref:sulfotransferase family protein n=1 Tax=Streptomyces sp. NPDC091371 TaxID=3155303 RepID=UPI0034254791
MRSGAERHAQRHPGIEASGREPVRPLDAGELLAAATAGAGTAGAGTARAGSGSFRFLSELELLVESVNAESRLTASGRAAVRDRLVAALTHQRRLHALVKASPAISATPITRPVFIAGLPGSGASLLQNLLVEHPLLDSPVLWELLDPASEGSDYRHRRTLIERARTCVERSRASAPQCRLGRLREATRPGGCHRLLANAFQSPMFGMGLRVPRYLRWLEGRDLSDAYAFHRTQLQAVTSRIPAATLLLRDPFHAAYVGGLLHAYPDARVIRVHRELAHVVAATAGLSSTLRSATSTRVDPRGVRREWAGHLERHLARADGAAGALEPGRLLDVRHDDLVADPAGVVRRVLEFLEVEPAPAVMQNVRGLARSAYGI